MTNNKQKKVSPNKGNLVKNNQTRVATKKSDERLATSPPTLNYSQGFSSFS